MWAMGTPPGTMPSNAPGMPPGATPTMPGGYLAERGGQGLMRECELAPRDTLALFCHRNPF